MRRLQISTPEQLERRDMFAGFQEVCSVDDLYAAIRQRDVQFDLNEDGLIDLNDARFLVEDIQSTRMADLDKNGQVDFQDFIQLAKNFGDTDASHVQGDLDGDGTVRFDDFIKLALDFGYVSPNRILPIKDGAGQIPNRTAFELFAHNEDVPGALGIREVKFVVDVAADDIYFLNHNKYSLHYDFTRDALGYLGSPEQYMFETYFTDSRRFIAGSLLAHDNFQHESGTGIFAVEFWPTDPVKIAHVDVTMRLLHDTVPFAADKLYYHPAGETQRDLFATEELQYAAANIPTITTEELFGNQIFAALNHGVAYGRLRVVDGSDAIPLGIRDLVIFKHIPNDLTIVAGVITVEPQTPLSHVNLRAKQNDTPNAYIRDALENPEFEKLVGKTVRFEVVDDGYTIREATVAEVDEHFSAIRPVETQFPLRDLSRRDVVPLADLRTADQTAYGAKAANLGELAHILPDAQVPDGLAVPFAFYDDYMRANGFYAVAQSMLVDPDFQSDAGVREEMLSAFRRRIRNGVVPSEISAQLEAADATLKEQHGLTASFRARSSTNNEDLEGFTGAGLYSSHTHRPNEGKLENTVRQVWASLWTFRAYEEREFWRIDHMTAAMGVAIHPNFDFEEVNGVAVTKNIYDPIWQGFYVNAQLGEDLVTNPEGGAVPEQFLISAIGPRREWEVQYIRHSNLTENGVDVLSVVHIQALLVAMQEIQRHFRQVYDATDDPSFAMDIEFKVDREGQLIIKQARPWVD